MDNKILSIAGCVDGMPQHLAGQKSGVVSQSAKVASGSRGRSGKEDATSDMYITALRWGIWAYFLLLIFEGALRKWFLPSLATPLLVVRDPLAMGLVGVAIYRGLIGFNGFIVTMATIGILGIYTAVYLGHGSFAVAAYGSRILLFHFPLMFVIGEVFSRADVIRIGKVTLWIAIPMTVLIALQFYSPQSAWVNRGVGGDTGGAGFDGAMGFFRPPGTFSFTNGNSLFYGFLGPFVFYFWLNLKKVSKPILILATIGLLGAIPLSISRTLLFHVILTLLFTTIAISRRPKFLGPFLLGIAAVGVALAIISTTPLYDTAMEAFEMRFTSAGKAEGGLQGTLGDRFLGGLIGAIGDSLEAPFFGLGMGMGTNVGSMILSGKQDFLITEEEWGRIIGEVGPILGLALIFCRTAFCFDLLLKSYRCLIEGEILPWLLLSYGMICVAQGAWSQPTALGFSTMIGGLMLASIKSPTTPRRHTQIRKPLRRRRKSVIAAEGAGVKA